MPIDTTDDNRGDTVTTELTYIPEDEADKTDQWWRWKLLQYTPEQLAVIEDKLERAGFVIRDQSGSGNAINREWCQPGGGSVYGYLTDQDGREWLTTHAFQTYWHDQPDCTKCGVPTESQEAWGHCLRGGLCLTCSFWQDRLTSGTQFLIAANKDGTRTSYADSGAQASATGRSKSHLGFGGSWWSINPLDSDTAAWETNNLFTQGNVPPAWYDEFPVTHVVTPKYAKAQAIRIYRDA